MATIYKTNAGAVINQLGLWGRRIADDKPLLERFGRRMTEHSIPQNFTAGGRPERWAEVRRAGQPLLSSARLRNSIRAEAARHRLRVGTNVRYARVHQEGGTISAKNKALAIPVNIKARRTRPAQYGSSLRWTPTRNGRGRLVEAVGRGKRQRLVTRFVLKSKVTIEARPYLLFQREDLAWFERETFKYVTARRA